jgi:hypothetical protein
MEALKSQVNILDLFEELSYNDLKDVMDKWLNPEAAASEIVTEPTASGDDDETPFPTSPVVTSQAKAVQSPSTAKAKGKDSVDQAFDDLFNS